jgi:hypothetical protein
MRTVGVAVMPNFLKMSSPWGSWDMARKTMKLALRKSWNLAFSKNC